MQITITTGISSTMIGYDLLMKIVDNETGEVIKRIETKNISAKAISAYYNRSRRLYNGFPSTIQQWTVDLTWEQHRRIREG